MADKGWRCAPSCAARGATGGSGAPWGGWDPPRPAPRIPAPPGGVGWGLPPPLCRRLRAPPAGAGPPGTRRSRSGQPRSCAVRPREEPPRTCGGSAVRPGCLRARGRGLRAGCGALLRPEKRVSGPSGSPLQSLVCGEQASFCSSGYSASVIPSSKWINTCFPFSATRVIFSEVETLAVGGLGTELPKFGVCGGAAAQGSSGRG